MQSTIHSGLHVAIIMDGNGRWATRRHLPRSAGHRAGVQALRRIVEAAPSLGIAILTVFAFSADNWRRPQAEVTGLMGLLRFYLTKDIRTFTESGIRLKTIGRRDRLADDLIRMIEHAESATSAGQKLTLRVALDYSSRDAIVRAATTTPDQPTRETIAAELGDAGQMSDVDLLIRTGGEKRLSDFLLWESAYAELHFTDVMWPDFSADELAKAIADFNSRDRRYGGLSSQAATAA